LRGLNPRTTETTSQQRTRRRITRENNSTKISRKNKKPHKKVAKKNSRKNKKPNKKVVKKNNRKNKKPHKQVGKQNHRTSAKKSKGKKGKKNKARKGKKGKKGKARKEKKNKKPKGSKSRRKNKNSVKAARKTGKSGRACLATTCVDNAIKYMSMLKSKVVNFKKQKARIASSKKQAGGKAGKKGLFKGLVLKIKEAGGGNSSALKCNGKTGTPGALKFVNLTSELGACEASINKKCNTDLPAINQTEIDTCSTAIDAFVSLTTPAIAAKGEAACKLWVADDMTAAAAKVKVCDVSSTNSKMVKAKTACAKAFGSCRKVEDTVSEALSACSPANSLSAVKAAIAQGTKNLAAAKKVSAKVASAKATRTTRAAMACGSFAVKIAATAGELEASPLLAGIIDILNAVLALTVSPCSAAEKLELASAEDSFTGAVETIELAIEEKQKDLEISTGSTADPNTTPASTSGQEAVEIPNASVTTAAGLAARGMGIRAAVERFLKRSHV
jgi:hypothetical protein